MLPKYPVDGVSGTARGYTLRKDRFSNKFQEETTKATLSYARKARKKVVYFSIPDICGFWEMLGKKDQ